MAELRWILLLAGVVFLVALAVWEQRRPRQASREPDVRSREDPPFGTLPESAAAASQSPVMPDPRSSAAAHATMTADAAPTGPLVARARLADPPIFDLPSIDLPRIEAGDAAPTTAFDSLPRIEARPRAPTLEPMHAAASASDAGFEEVIPLPASTEVDAALPEALAVTMPNLIVDWPPDSERHIVALRLVAADAERLPGRALRQALSACGFLHGRFAIFHQPGADGRALLSVASLSKPGIFDLENIDFHRFVGLNLFVVLPGPLLPEAALEHLLSTAQELARRLGGRVQDEHGHSLDQERIAALRAQVAALPPTTWRAEPAA